MNAIALIWSWVLQAEAAQLLQVSDAYIMRIAYGMSCVNMLTNALCACSYSFVPTRPG